MSDHHEIFQVAELHAPSFLMGQDLHDITVTEGIKDFVSCGNCDGSAFKTERTVDSLSKDMSTFRGQFDLLLSIHSLNIHSLSLLS
jgi:hypothetical protein